MHKIIFLFILATKSVCLSAQWSVGLRTDYVLPRVIHENTNQSFLLDDKNALRTFTYSGIVQLDPLDWMTIEASLGFSRNGEHLASSQLAIQSEMDFVTLQGKSLLLPFGKDKVSPFFALGGYVNQRVAGRFYAISLIDVDYSEDFDRNLHKTDFGITFGTGFLMQFGRIRPQIGIDYQLGLRELGKLPYNPEENSLNLQQEYVESGVKLRAFQFSVGLSYSLWKQKK